MAHERRGPAGWAIHPGEILKLEFLKPLNLSGYALAKGVGVHAQTISDILLRKRGISADMAIRLGKYLKTTPEFWMNLQTSFELSNARKTLKHEIAKIHPHDTEAA
jgi:addiction module HigA family antidote